MALVLLAGCRGRPGENASLHAVAINPHDTVEFAAAARAHWCGGGRGVLLDGATGGNGVLLWVRMRDTSLNGGEEYPLLTLGDSVTPRGAVVGLRFMLRQADRGVTLDSGGVTLDGHGKRIDARVSGSGLDHAAGDRVSLRASFVGVPLAPDTVGCQVRLGR